MLLQIHKLMSTSENSFPKIVSVWKDGWDDSLKTVLPRNLVDAAINAEKEFPNKRLIKLFMQPHIPFIGNLELPQFNRETTMRTWGLINEGKTNIYSMNSWVEVDKGNITFDQT